MENLKPVKKCAAGIQVSLDDWVDKNDNSWDFLLKYPQCVLGEVAMTMMEGRVKRDVVPAMNFLMFTWETCRYSNPIRRSRAFSVACIQQAYLELDKGNYTETIVLVSHSEIYSASGDVEWVWNLAPLSYMDLMHQSMTDQQEFVKHLCDVKNG